MGVGGGSHQYVLVLRDLLDLVPKVEENELSAWKCIHVINVKERSEKEREGMRQARGRKRGGKKERKRAHARAQEGMNVESESEDEG